MNAIYFNETITKQPLKQGLLDECTFAVKDVFAVEGERNSAGNPTWYETHVPARQTADVIDQLRKEGATLRGFTHTDELMYSLNGENVHYGTPPNPLDENRIPGGSSNGSAAATIERDFTVGTDTGGSIRVPASYCGVYGIRPTHAAVSLDGVIPLASSFDTVGWMSTSSSVLKRVGDVLFDTMGSPFTQVIVDEMAWSFLAQDDQQILKEALAVVPTSQQQITENLADWASLFRNIQGMEIWQTHGAWIEREQPNFAPAIAERFQWASELNTACYEKLKMRQEQVTDYMQQQLLETDVLVIPTTASVAPRKNAPVQEVEDIRTKTMQLTCIAGLTGFPQVTVPVMRPDGLALGLSFIANKGCDRQLLHFVDEYFGGVR
ncbi:MAG: amidase [Solibacillus sp.]